MTPAQRLSERLSLMSHFQKVLDSAAKERSKRPEFVKGASGWSEPAWVLHERQTMFAEVNRLRGERGRRPVTLEDVAKVERCASGHVDYATKFPLYCAEIVLGESPNVPERS